MVYALLVLALAAETADAQEGHGSTALTLAGGALGLMAGVIAGNVGSILPCTQTPLGNSCVGGASILGGVIGLGSGIAVGDSDPGVVTDRAYAGLVGLAVASAIGLAGRSMLPRVGLADVLTVGVVGGVIGTQPRGALAGVAIGSALGVALWSTVPGFEAPDIAAASIAGAMVGVLAAWVGDAVDASASDPGTVPLLTITWTP